MSRNKQVIAETTLTDDVSVQKGGENIFKIFYTSALYFSVFESIFKTFMHLTVSCSV